MVSLSMVLMLMTTVVHPFQGQGMLTGMVLMISSSGHILQIQMAILEQEFLMLFLVPPTLPPLNFQILKEKVEAALL